MSFSELLGPFVIKEDEFECLVVAVGLSGRRLHANPAHIFMHVAAGGSGLSTVGTKPVKQLQNQLSTDE